MSIEADGQIIAEAQAAVALKAWVADAIEAARTTVLWTVERNGVDALGRSRQAYAVPASIVVLAERVEALERRLDELERRNDGEETE